MTEISSVDLDDIYDTSEEETKHRKAFARQANQSSLDGSTGSYVLKMLRDDLPDDERTKGIVDLAIEAEFLAVLSHPNIIAMRAMANSDPHAGRFFVVLDRLTQTLDKKFHYWRKLVGDNAGYWFPLMGYCCAKTPTLHALWKERIAAALNISKAIQHLHRLGIVYRDLVRCCCHCWMRRSIQRQDHRPFSCTLFLVFRNPTTLDLTFRAASRCEHIGAVPFACLTSFCRTTESNFVSIFYLSLSLFTRIPSHIRFSTLAWPKDWTKPKRLWMVGTC